MADIYGAMTAAMADISAIAKNRNNQQQGFKFRGIDDVYNELHDILAEHKIFTMPEVLHDRTEERTTKNGGALIYRVLTMKYTFFAADGSNVSCVVIGEGMDSGDKAANKAMSIAHKYALFQTFLIPTEDDKDPDGQSHEVAPKVEDFAREAEGIFKPISDAKARGLHSFLGSKGIKDSHEFASKVIGRKVEHFTDMNDEEAEQVKQAALNGGRQS